MLNRLLGSEQMSTPPNMKSKTIYLKYMKNDHIVEIVIAVSDRKAIVDNPAQLFEKEGGKSLAADLFLGNHLNRNDISDW